MVTTTNLKGYWKLDEASGNAIDAHTTAKDLTEAGTVPSQTGIINGGRGAYSSANNFKNTSVLTLNQNVDYSVSFWIKRTADLSASTNRVLTGGLFSTNGYNFMAQFSNSNKLTISADKFGVVILLSLITTSDIPLNTWTHIGFTHNGTTRENILYVNGSSDASGTESSNTFSTAANYHIGIREGTFGPATNTYVDENGYWNEILSPTDMSDLYNSGAGLAYPFSVGWDNKIFGTVPGKVNGIDSANILKVLGVA